MPRQKRVRVMAELLEPEERINLPIPAIRREHDHRVDSYRPLAGAMPPPEGEKRGRGRPRKDDVQAIARKEQRQRVTRYHAYLNNLATFMGDTEQALAVAYQISIESVRERYDELMSDVQSGIPSSSVQEMLNQMDLNKAAQLALLRFHAYNIRVPAASLKALDMISELEGGVADAGSFEQYVRMAMAK